jgi:hypothetical protein
MEVPTVASLLNAVLDQLERLPDMAFALVVIFGSLTPIALVGVVIFAVTDMVLS